MDLVVWPLYLLLSVLVGVVVYYAVKVIKTTIEVSCFSIIMINLVSTAVAIVSTFCHSTWNHSLATGFLHGLPS